MEYKKFGDTYVLRVAIGEDIKEQLMVLAEEQSISFATITGIGACDEVEISIFYPERKEYERKTICEELELVSLMGNISLNEKRPHVHVHATFSNGYDTLYAGHLDRGVVCATAELFIQTKAEELHRKPCDKTGLMILDLS